MRVQMRGAAEAEAAAPMPRAMPQLRTNAFSAFAP